MSVNKELDDLCIKFITIIFIIICVAALIIAGYIYYLLNQ